MFHRLDQICELQWQSEERQIWLPMAGGSCTDWSNLRCAGRIYDFRRYITNIIENSSFQRRYIYATSFKDQFITCIEVMAFGWNVIA